MSDVWLYILQHITFLLPRDVIILHAWIALLMWQAEVRCVNYAIMYVHTTWPINHHTHCVISSMLKTYVGPKRSHDKTLITRMTTWLTPSETWLIYDNNAVIYDHAVSSWYNIWQWEYVCCLTAITLPHDDLLWSYHVSVACIHFRWEPEMHHSLKNVPCHWFSVRTQYSEAKNGMLHF